MGRKSPEFKEMIGGRIMDSDGFTYTYGKTSNEYRNKKRNKNVANRSRRNDKRSVKAKELKREIKEQE